MITQTNLGINYHGSYARNIGDYRATNKMRPHFSSRKRTSLKVLITYEENFPLAFFVPPVLDDIKILVRKKTVFGK